MSVAVMSAVFKRYPAGGGEMLLALALADRAADDGRLMINDSVAELARKTRQTERGVRLQLRRMELMGWLHQVQPSDGGRGRVSVYRIDQTWIDGGDLNPEPRSGLDAANPEPASGFADPETRNAEARNPERGSGAYRPREPNTEIPPNPPLRTKGGNDLVAQATLKTEDPLAAGAPPPPPPDCRTSRRGADTALTLRAWLDACKLAGEKPIPEGDAVFAYAERVGIGRDILLLHWGEFKARRAESRKRQSDWRQTLRNSVRDNWYGLWWIPPGRPAELTSKGRQAQAAQQAEALAAATTAAASQPPLLAAA